MTGTDDLAQFVRDRLDEDEMLAEQAAECGAPEWDKAADVLLLPGLANRRRLAARGVEGALDGAVDAHHARHDPARVLADIEAKRQLVARIENHALLMGRDEIHGDLLRLLAAPYAAHPDYREEWRP